MNIFIWFLWFLLSEIIVSLIEFILRKKKHKRKYYLLLVIIKFVLAILFAFLPLGGPVFMRPIQPLLLGLYVVLTGEALIDLINCIFNFKFFNNFNIRKSILFVSSLIYFIIGTINMCVVRPNEHTYYARIPLNHEYKFVFLSDMHVGSPQSLNITKKYIDEINEIENLDFVVIGGDMFDDYTTKDEMVEAISYFKNFNAQVYYVYGNHDRQASDKFAGDIKFTDEEMISEMNDAGIVILKDDTVCLNNELIILGREDMSQESRLNYDELNINKDNKCLIIFDHQPSDKEQIRNLDPFLQISGHTHAGQFFPLRLFYNIAIGPTYGQYRDQSNGSLLLVSAGVAGWRVPFRSDAANQYEVITIK